ncbi:uncharacterized protein LOC119828543 [Zerene cesonia]|uniref:uncharacterized protein LOC119828543 n=1 Tax=Zerene cesonia TaxID=33412 RepID=UPI0018E5850D|nr:uncharacterized protein LOC119828543 [Zerene cesonia]
MYFCKFFGVVVILAVGIQATIKKKAYPPHCTQVTKDTDYASRFKMDYPVLYINPGVSAAHQKLYCINPPAINKAVTVVCDWAAPPLVQFTLGDEYMQVVRQDPNHKYLGNAVIKTYQLCNHTTVLNEDNNNVTITEMYVDSNDIK